MATQRKLICADARLWAYYSKAAKRQGISLSEWIRQQCTNGLPPKIQARLGVYTEPGASPVYTQPAKPRRKRKPNLKEYDAKHGEGRMPVPDRDWLFNRYQEFISDLGLDQQEIARIVALADQYILPPELADMAEKAAML